MICLLNLLILSDLTLQNLSLLIFLELFDISFLFDCGIFNFFEVGNIFKNLLVIDLAILNRFIKAYMNIFSAIFPIFLPLFINSGIVKLKVVRGSTLWHVVEEEREVLIIVDKWLVVDWLGEDHGVVSGERSTFLLNLFFVFILGWCGLCWWHFNLKYYFMRGDCLSKTH